mmetsp:Transcript_28638/g.91338  ORF Transcript_28638/g.91338 Transcript_28638/m.91338 type:complete len:588 (+) Transcript_28638:731-2494(+)
MVEERGLVPEEEGQQESADVRPIHVRVGEDHDLVVAQGGDVELLALEPEAERKDEVGDLLVLVDRGVVAPFYVEDLPPQREDGLEATIPRLLGAAPRRVPLHQEDLPPLGAHAGGAVAQLARQHGSAQHALLAHELARLLGRLGRLHRRRGLAQHGRHGRGVELQRLLHRRAHRPVHQFAHLGVAEARLGLPLELGLGDLDAHHPLEALPAVLPAQPRAPLLGHVVLDCQLVERPRERGLEAVDVRPAVHRADGVGVAQEHLAVAVLAPLQGGLHHHAALLLGEGDGLVQRLVVPVHPLHVLQQAPRKVELLPPLVLPQRLRAVVVPRVAQPYVHPAVEEGQLAVPRREGAVVEGDTGLEHLGVRLEAHQRAPLLAALRLVLLRVQGALRHAPDEALLVALPLSPHAHLELLAQRVHHGDAHAVQPPRHLVPAVIAPKLAPCVQDREHSLQRRLARARVEVRGDAAPIVVHAHPPVRLQIHLDHGGVPRLHLVDSVVEDLVHQVVQPSAPRAPDVHAGAPSHGLEPLQHLNLPRIIVPPSRGGHRLVVGERRGAQKPPVVLPDVGSSAGMCAACEGEAGAAQRRPNP